MSTRARLGAIAGAGLVALAVVLYALIFYAPVFLLMPHQPRDTSSLFSPTKLGVVAHRGWSGAAPENTVAAFEKAVEGGFWIELDVTLASSGEVVVIHDDTVDRTTDGTGEVAQMSWDQLKDLDAGGWFDPRFAGEPLPTLDRVFQAVPGDTVVLVEMKTGDDKGSLPRAVAEAIRKAGRAQSTIVISFDPFMLEQLRLASPELLRGQLVGDYEDSDLAFYEKRALQNLAFTDRVQQDLVLWQHDLLDQTLVGRMKDHGYAVVAWTVNEPEDIARMRELGVDAIISDHPDRAR